MNKNKIQLFIFFIAAFFGLCLSFQNVKAATVPVLNFSDIISGPSSGLGDGLGDGAIVTIWGNNLGESQGSSALKIGGLDPAHIYYWKNADGNLPGGPSDLYTYHEMQEIAFSIPSSLSEGEYEITVTVNGQTSNQLLFTVRSGNIYHAKTSGNSGALGTFNDPLLSIYEGGLSKVSAGDILYLHDGVSDVNTYGTTGILISGKTSSLATQRAFIAYPNSRYIVTGYKKGIDTYLSDSIVLSKLKTESGYYDEPDPASIVILGTDGGGTGIKGSKNGRLVGNEITEIAGKCSSGYSGAIMASGGGAEYDYTGNLKIFGNYIHDWGCNQTTHYEHTTYISIRNGGAFDVEAWEFGWNMLKDNKAKYGIHNYDETFTAGAGNCGVPIGTVKIHDNYVINQKGAGIQVGSSAPKDYVCWTGKFDIYNNMLIHTGKGPADDVGADMSAIRISDGGLQATINVYNNTIYGYGDDSSPYKGAITFSYSTNGGYASANFKNNIIYDKLGHDYTNINETVNTSVSGSNNLWYSSIGVLNSTVDSRFTDNIFQNPRFVDVNGNYRLSSDSPAIDAGVPGISNKDFFQLLRPQGSAFDLGAIEYFDPTIPYLSSSFYISITKNISPSFNFSSSDPGVITYAGSCSSATTLAIAGENSIILNTLSIGNYSDCTITVTDSSGNISTPLFIPEFTITYPSDNDLDKDVDIFDYNILLTEFGKTNDCQNQADTNEDCKIDIFDYNNLLADFGKSI